MQFLIRLLKILAVLIGIYMVAAFFGSSNYRVERKSTINAPQKLVFTQVSVLRNWNNWSPWAEKDPSIINTYEGTDGEVGSTLKWSGNEDISGTGQLSISAMDAPTSINYDLSFIEPFEMSSKGGFELTADSESSTTINWYDEGDIPFLMRPIMFFMDMDKHMGADFERGLFKIDSVCSGIYQEMLKIMAQDSMATDSLQTTVQ